MSLDQAAPRSRRLAESLPSTHAEHLWAEHGWALGATGVTIILALVLASAGAEALLRWAGVMPN